MNEYFFSLDSLKLEKEECKDNFLSGSLLLLPQQKLGLSVVVLNSPITLETKHFIETFE